MIVTSSPLGQRTNYRPPVMPRYASPLATRTMGPTYKVPRKAAPRYVPTNAAQPSGLPPGYQGAATATKYPGTFNYASDPILQSIIAGSDRDIARGRSELLDTQKSILLRLGSQDVARKLLGNDPFVDTISSDPNRSFSSLAQIGRQYDQNLFQTNENLNQQNLFYSGARVKGLQDLSYDRARAENEAVTSSQDALTQAMQQFNAIQDQAMSNRTAAEADAYQRALEMALMYGYVPGGTTGGGGAGAAPAPTASVMTAAKLAQLEKLLGG